MRSKKGFFGINLILAVVALILMAVTAGLATHAGYDDVQDGFYYQDYEDGVRIVYCELEGDVVIPNYLDGKPVRSVARADVDVFKNADAVTSLTLPSTLREIGSYAFKGCSSLTSVTIPDNVLSVGEGAFSGCSALETMKLPLIGYPLGYVFGRKLFAHASSSRQPYGYDDDQSREYFDYCIPVSLSHVIVTGESIPAGAFSDCYFIESITITDGVMTIGEDAFDGCKGVTSVIIPDSVIKIEESAFNGCAFKISWGGRPQIKEIGNNAFYGYDGTSLTIPNSVMSIGDHAFAYCDSLTSITIPDSVTSIGSDAFYNCDSLTSVTIGNGVTSIGSDAFSGCDSLTSVTIPDSVTSIGGSTFYGCDSLTSVTIGNGVTSIGNYAFRNCDSLEAVHITDIGKWAAIDFDGTFGSCYANPLYYAGNLYLNGELVAGELIIPDGVTSIGNYAFYGYDRLTSVTIPDSVTSIGGDAFADCDNLSFIIFEGTMTEWDAISKGYEWEYWDIQYVQCSDGRVYV